MSLAEVFGPDSADRHVCAVIPAKNEVKNIGWVLDRIPQCVDEIIVVDGYSDDGTRKLLAEKYPDVRVIMQKGAGKGAALRTGFDAVRSDIIVMLDADGSMDPGEIPRFVAMVDAGYDFVKGSRFMAGGGSKDITGIRRFGNDGLRRLMNRLFNTRFTDLCYGYCAFRRDCLADMNLRSSGFEIETELAVNALQARLRISEVPSFELERLNGDSNLNAIRDGSRALATMVSGRILYPAGPKPIAAVKSSVLDLTGGQSLSSAAS